MYVLITLYKKVYMELGPSGKEWRIVVTSDERGSFWEGSREDGQNSWSFYRHASRELAIAAARNAVWRFETTEKNGGDFNTPKEEIEMPHHTIRKWIVSFAKDDRGHCWEASREDGQHLWSATRWESRELALASARNTIDKFETAEKEEGDLTTIDERETIRAEESRMHVIERLRKTRDDLDAVLNDLERVL